MKGGRVFALFLAIQLSVLPVIWLRGISPVFAANSANEELKELLDKVNVQLIDNSSQDVQITHKTTTRIVTFSHKLSSQEIAAYEQKYEIHIASDHVYHNRYIVTPDNEEKMTELLNDSSVVLVSNNDMYKVAAQTIDWGIQKMNVPSAWENIAPSTGDSVVVALIDTGVQFTHPDLTTVFLPGGYDFVNDDNDPTDDHGHGTAMAGAIAANDNTIGFKGAAFKAKILPYKVCGADAQCSAIAIADAVDAAVAADVDIINLSLGGTANSLIQSSVQAATDAGIIVVAAAGNAGAEGCLYPAAYDNVVCVGSTDSNDARSSFSNYGTGLDIMTPGASVATTGLSNTYVSVSGTSISTAYYSGVAAIVREMVDDLCVSEPSNVACSDKRAYIQGLLNLTTVRDIGVAGYDAQFGNGIVDVSQLFANTNVAHTAAVTQVKQHTYYTDPITLTNNTGNNIALSSCTIYSKNMSRLQTLPALTATGLVHNATVYSNPMQNVYYTTFTFPTPIQVTNGTNVNFNYAYLTGPESAVNDVITYGFECTFDNAATPQVESLRTDPAKSSMTVILGIPDTLKNVYFTFGNLKYNQTVPSSQLFTGDMVYLKYYNPQKLKVTQFFLYDYVKRGNQGFTKTWKTSTTLFVRTNYLIPRGRKYAYVVEFQDTTTGAKAKKYFVFYTR